jgi:hypothetical protein
LVCVTYEDKNIIVFPSPNIGNINVTRVRDWYDIRGNGTRYIIERLAVAAMVNNTEFSIAKRGLLISVD